MTDDSSADSLRRASLDLFAKCERFCSRGLTITGICSTVNHMVSSYESQTTNGWMDNSSMGTSCGSTVGSIFNDERLSSSSVFSTRVLQSGCHSSLSFGKQSCGIPKDRIYYKVIDYNDDEEWIGFIDYDDMTLFLSRETIEGTQGGTSITRKAGFKQRIIALLDLAIDCLNCHTITVFLDRNISELSGVLADLNWVGFNPIVLNTKENTISDSWVALRINL